LWYKTYFYHYKENAVLARSFFVDDMLQTTYTRLDMK